MPNKLVKFNRYKHKKSTWITHGLLTSIRYRDKMYKQLKLTNPSSYNYETIKINLKTYSTILKKNIRAAKQIYFESRFSLFKNVIRNTWKTINECLSKKRTKNSFPVHFEDNGNQMSDKQKIADTFNNYFTNIAQTIVNDIKYEGTKDFSYYLNRQIHSSFQINNVDEEAVKKIIYNLPTKHSCGFDGISSKFLNIIEPAIIKSLTMVINQVQNTGIFPDKLKIAKVTPIFKKGDPTLFKNYRPISLLPTISKVLEKIIFTQLSSYFNKAKLFFDNQYGFRPKHCTEYAALELVDIIINHMDKNEVPINIFLDLSKAFDTIDHNILLHKLRFYGLDGASLLLFESYLSNRRQYVEIDEVQSETLPVKIGVPQGSI